MSPSRVPALTTWSIIALLHAAGCPAGVDDDQVPDVGELAPPSEFTGIVEEGQYRLRWSALAGEGEAYHLERRREQDADYVTLARLDMDESAYLDADYSADERPRYRISVVRGDRRSEYAYCDSTVPHWTYVRIVAFDALWGSLGPTMDDVIAQHVTAGLQAAGGSNENINLVLLGDSYGDEGSLYAFVGPEGPEYRETPELNLGDVETYREFFDWVVANHPGQRYVVSYWSHGSGAVYRSSSETAGEASIGFDFSDGDMLEPEEMGSALSYLAEITGHPVEVFSVCACLTAMVENAYALGDSTRYLVAGESTVGCRCDVLDVLYGDPDRDAEWIADATVDAHASDTPNDVVFSSVRLDHMGEMAQELDQLAQALLSFIDEDPSHADTILAIADETQNLDYSGGSVPSTMMAYLDLHDLCERLRDVDDPAVAEQALAVETFLDEELITNWMVQNDLSGLYEDCRGLSIYHPTPSYDVYSSSYGSLSFAEDTAWDEYLIALWAD